MADAFTLSDLQPMADVVAACQRGARVRWLDEDGETIRTGTMRHVCRDESGAFLAADADVRTALVRITASTGFEVFLPLPTFARWTGEGCVAFDS